MGSEGGNMNPFLNAGSQMGCYAGLLCCEQVPVMQLRWEFL